ncbi:MAG: peptidyl-prolyl cis-trans isomerase [Xanthomonadales bacterium]|nr:peptidyl-prolyl cis-trans isomerase [Xanthomonadales bacterium]NNL96284.1 peptidyl-prolyl cis-trans isomerase [Xanthomonadales bacterium]
MIQRLLILLALLSLSSATRADCDLVPDEVLSDNMFPTIRFETSMGNIVVELNRMRAPATVNNFLAYVLNGSYKGTIFHRVMPGFVVQGGGYSPEYAERALRPPVLNESGNGLENDRGTIAMARFSDPHSATRQFYFNMSDNDSLNPNRRSWGYTVFGDVIEGLEVLDAIAAVETGYSEGLDAPDVPLVPVTLLDVVIVDP